MVAFHYAPDFFKFLFETQNKLQTLQDENEKLREELEQLRTIKLTASSQEEEIN